MVVFRDDAIHVRAAGATAIEAAWLPEVAAPLCTLSPPLEEPPPQYSPDVDAVLCWHEVCARCWSFSWCQEALSLTSSLACGWRLVLHSLGRAGVPINPICPCDCQRS